MVWTSFAIGRMQMPWVAQSVLLGGHVRVGLEDNLYLGRGNKVTNADLVANAVTIITAMGAEVATPDEAREILALRPAVTAERVAPDQVRTVACVGAGVIGGGWVAYFLARGFTVRAWDPAPDAEARLRGLVDAAWPALTELGLAPGASVDNLTVAAELAAAVADADVVQESAPEQLDLKRGLLAAIDAATPEHVVVASSTSGFGMTEMATEARTPQRLVVAHPFNPPYLIPLVEVVGGEKTTADVVAWTAAFFRHIGKSVITMDREVPGFIANRLQEALWREALHMVANGEATVEQIDASITDGPGPAVGVPRPDAHVPPRGRAGRHGAHARPLRTVAALAVDPAGRPRAHPRAARPRGARLRRRGRVAQHRRPGARTRPRARRPPARAGQAHA